MIRGAPQSPCTKPLLLIMYAICFPEFTHCPGFGFSYATFPAVFLVAVFWMEFFTAYFACFDYTTSPHLFCYTHTTKMINFKYQLRSYISLAHDILQKNHKKYQSFLNSGIKTQSTYIPKSNSLSKKVTSRA